MSCSTSRIGEALGPRARAAGARARRSRPRRDPTTVRRAAARAVAVPSARPSSTSRAVPVGSESTLRSGDRGRCRPARGARRRRSRARRSVSVAQRRRISSATSTFSRAVRLPNGSSRWNVRAMPSRARRVALGAGDVERRRAGCRPDGRLLQPGDDVEQRRLPGAVRTDQPGDPAGLDLDRRAIEREQTAERNRDVVDLEERHGDQIVDRGRCRRPGTSLVIARPRSRMITSASVNGRSIPRSPTSGSGERAP